MSGFWRVFQVICFHGAKLSVKRLEAEISLII
jgi:hypothetical protein